MEYALDLGSSSSTWDSLTDALNSRVNEIRRSTYLLIEDKSRSMFAQDLEGLHAQVTALESQVAELRARLKEETNALPKVEALVRACQQQESDLNLMAAHLPTHLPSFAGATQAAHQGKGHSALDDQGHDDVRAGRLRDTGMGSAAAASGASDSRKAAAGAAAQAMRPAPRWYVTENELAGVASYMRGRLTLDKVNSAVEELAGFADANSRLMAQARGTGGAGAGAKPLSGAERKRATELLHSVASKEGVKGKPWFLEGDLKDGVTIKLDKTGRSILTLLRHLQRLQEVRCSVDNVSSTAYVLHHPSM